MADQFLEQTISGPFSGLVTNRDAALLSANEASDCSNVVFDGYGIKKRRGCSQIAVVSPAPAGERQSSEYDDFSAHDDPNNGLDHYSAYVTYSSWSKKLESNGWIGTDNSEAIWSPVSTEEGMAAYYERGYCEPEVSIDIKTGTSLGDGDGWGGLFVYYDVSTDACYIACITTADGVGANQVTSNIYSPISTTGVSLWRYDGGTSMVMLAENSGYTLTDEYQTLKVTAVGAGINVYVDDELAISYADKSLVKYNGCNVGVAAGCGCGTGETGSDINLDNYSVSEIFSTRKIVSYVDASADRKTIAFVNDSIYLIGSDGSTSGVASNASNPNIIPSISVYGGKVYIAQGDGYANTHSVPCVTDGTTRHALLISAPAAAPTLAVSGSSGLTGEYDYKYTYYSSTWGIESPASPLSASISPVGQQVDVTMVLSADTRVDKHRLYRRKSSALETDWTLVEEFAEGVSYADTVGDLDTNEVKVAPLSSSSAYPYFEVNCVYNERMYWSYGSKLYYSEMESPGTVVNYFIVGDEGETDKITGLVAMYGVLVIFKENSIWIHSGYNSSDFTVSKVIDGVGAIGHASICAAGDYIYFASDRSINRFDGSSVYVLSDSVSDIWQSRNIAGDGHAVMVYDPHHDAVLISFFGNDTGNNDRVLVYFVGYSINMERHVWSEWSFAKAPTSFCFMPIAGSIVKYLFFGSADGLINLMYKDSSGGDNGYFPTKDDTYSDYNGTTDVAVSMSYTTGKLDCGAFDSMKHWGDITAGMKQQGSSTNNLSLSYSTDDDAFSAATDVDASAASIVRKNVAGQSRHIRLKVESDAAEPMDVNRLGIQYYIEGKA